MEPLDAFSLPSELLLLWHAHRTEILLSASILLACIQLAIHWRGTRSKAVLTPPLRSPVDEKPSLLARQQLAEAEHYLSSPTTLSSNTKAGPKRVTGVKRTKSSPSDAPTNVVETIQPLVFYFSLGGSTKAYAETLQQFLQTNIESEAKILRPIIHDLTAIDYDDFFISPPKPERPNIAHFYILLLPSYDISTELENFLEHLNETHHDFRIDTAPLSGLAGYSVFGFGDGQDWPTEEKGYCKDAVEVDKWMARLTGRKRAFPLGIGDVRKDAGDRLVEWTVGVQAAMVDIANARGLGEGVPGSGEAVESADEAEIDDEEDVDAPPPAKKQRKPIKRSQTSDLEDLKAPIPVDFTTTTKAPKPTAPKPMVPVNSPTHTSLTKQGYTIIGSHSGVKICRWTKSALRGRGSCYKYSFYGIASHLCMEATPSLSCSNKCVFCWRHGTKILSSVAPA